MPRTRRPQSGVARAAGRVASTTTSATKNVASAPVYRIPVGRTNPNCLAPTSEVGGTYPIVVQHRDNNVYIVSIDSDWLKSLIEGYDSLDLSNTTLTLNTVEWPVTLEWNLTITGDFVGTTATLDSINATEGSITTLTSTTFTATSISGSSVSADALSVSWDTALTGNLTVWGTTDLTWDLSVAWNETVTWNSTVSWISTTDSLVVATTGTIPTLTSEGITTWTLDATGNVTIWGTLGVTGDTTATRIITSSDVQVGWNLTVEWDSTFTWDTSVTNISSTWTAALTTVTVSDTLWVAWATTLSSSLNVAWATTLSTNTSVGWNLSVAGNETVNGTSTTTGNAIFSSDVSVAWNETVAWNEIVWGNLTVTGDTVISDDLTVSWSSHLADVETTGSVDVDWTLRTTWAVVAGNWISATGQIESDSLVTGNLVATNATINGNIALGNDATAPDFVLQSEKWVANGVVPLNANTKIDQQYLPDVFTTAIVKIWSWVFANSDTAVIEDSDITNDSAVFITNYSDLVWDIKETITEGQIILTSNEVETWGFKYVVMNPLS